jgi:dUTP pyrophosphatase
MSDTLAKSKHATTSAKSGIDANFEPDHLPYKYRPERATEDSSGVDLRADIERPTVIDPGESTLIPTGLHLELPSHLEAQVRPRSGLAYKSGITVLNSPGTIDSDYRGDIGVILINHSGDAYPVAVAERIAQLVIAPVVKTHLRYENSLSDTERGEGGFGHTGQD